ncbi:ras-related protein Rab-40B isoform X1 [Pteropus medius]|uniref:ras-related protein Rab-40B isoform X1 n=1 Tax=Pteropus vampyrus TaxID=132908 RepID=UPI00196BAA3B|nr:ras-related protein Rab-40B isoform X1 [Pteropus giganteus]
MGAGAGGRTMSAVGSPVRAYDFLLKFLLVGDSDVGKGEILASLQDGAAESPYGHPADFTIAADHVARLRVWPCALSFLTWICIPGLEPLETYYAA